MDKKKRLTPGMCWVDTLNQYAMRCFWMGWRFKVNDRRKKRMVFPALLSRQANLF